MKVCEEQQFSKTVLQLMQRGNAQCILEAGKLAEGNVLNFFLPFPLVASFLNIPVFKKNSCSSVTKI